MGKKKFKDSTVNTIAHITQTQIHTESACIMPHGLICRRCKSKARERKRKKSLRRHIHGAEKSRIKPCTCACMHACACVRGRDHESYDNVSGINWFAQKHPNEFDFKVVCGDEFSNCDKSNHACVCLCINDAHHGICLIAFDG